MEPSLVWGLGFLALGLIVLVIDIFVPTFGVLALVSAGSAVTGVVLLFTYSATWGLVGTTLVLIGAPVVFFLGLQIMPNTPIGRRLVLGNPRPDEEGEDAPPPAAPGDALKDLIGSEGVVVTDLRPVGTIRLGEERMDALAETTVLKAGSKVKVVGVVDGRLLKVRAVG